MAGFKGLYYYGKKWSGREGRGGEGKRGDVPVRSAYTVITFSHSVKPTGIVITTANYLKQLDGKLHEIWSAIPLKIVATSCEILKPNSISAGAPPHILLGELTAISRILSWI